MLDYAWIIPVIPAVSFALILFFGKRMPRQGSELGIAAVGAMRAFGRGLIASSGEHVAVQPVIHTVTWWQNGGIDFTVGTQIDGLAVMMLFVVTLISLLVHIYSTSYMKGDVRFTYYYAALSLFTASMLTLVVSDNLLQLL